MGERKGQNHYYPPDFNYKTHKTLNSYHGVHALRERGKRAHEGILTIRFEMPFNVWCLGCNNHVAMSVRYNAEKKKVGMYYTTPIYEFRMKCHLCDNYFTIRTDPKNFDYELVEGLRRQEIRFDPSTIDNLAPVDRTMSLKLGADAMFKAEHVVDDKQKLAGNDQQIQKLEWIQTRLYDDYSANQALRGAFRGEKRTLNERRAKDEAMKQRLSTQLALVPEREEDRRAAKRLALSKHMNVHNEPKAVLTKEQLMNQPIKFGGGGGAEMPSTSTQQSSAAEMDSKEMLMRKMQDNAIEQMIAATRNGSGGSGSRRRTASSSFARRDLLGIKLVSRNGGNGNGSGSSSGNGNGDGSRTEEERNCTSPEPCSQTDEVDEVLEVRGPAAANVNDDGPSPAGKKANRSSLPGLSVYDEQSSSSNSEEDEEENC